MTLSAVATRYANALADVVAAPGSTLRPDNALAELRSFETVIRGSHELTLVLGTPSIASSRKKAVIGKIAERMQLSPIVRNFLFVLTDRRRVGSLAQIIGAFETALDERMGIVRAEIEAPQEMDDTQRAALGAELEKLTGKRVRMAFGVNSSLIGGAIARVGSIVYDGSVRGSLASLAKRLSAES